MANTHTTTTQKTNHSYLRMLTLVAALAMVASLLGAPAARPAHAATTTFTVNSILDLGDVNPGDGVCDATASLEVTCTLRAAIQQANATSGANVIDFDIPSNAICDATTGVCTIRPSSILPPITEQVTINGYTQTGGHPNTKMVGNDASLKIELDGTNAPFGDGLEIRNASNSVIRGLVINDFQSEGIEINGVSAVGNHIEGNFIGTDPTGTLKEGNGIEAVAIKDGPSGTVVGGSAPEKRNVLSGSGAHGVFIANANDNLIQGNYVGTDKSGTKDLGNNINGLFFENVAGTTIGGTTAASRNVISGNDENGIEMDGSQGTKVLGNRIGTTASGTAALGNSCHGVSIDENSSANSVGDGTSAGSNTVAFNRLDGVNVDATSSRNRVSRNSIFSNAGLGIDLTGKGEGFFTDDSTANDPGDGDKGSNNLQNKPVITSARNASGKTTVKGKLNSTHGKTFEVQFFSNPKGLDEGKTFIGSKSVTTDASGNVSFTFSPKSKVALGQTVTATATKALTGDTSEFSLPRTVAAS